MPRMLKQFLIAILGLVLVWGSASPASANDTAYNTQYQYLTEDPILNGGQTCVARDIYLAEGEYQWSRYLKGPTFWAHEDPLTGIYLAAGTYHWTDCITQWSDGNYARDSILRTPGHSPVELYWQTNIYPSGWWTWGSSLHQISSP